VENKTISEPKSLQQAILYFSNPDNCTRYLAVRRWPNGVICPGCGSDRVSYNANRRTWKCSTHHPKREFSAKVGTIYEDSPISLDKWLAATWMLTNCKNGISSYEVGRDLKVTQRSAWFMLHRIRLALQGNPMIKLGGPGSEVEVDETFIGGKARNMHPGSARRRRLESTGVTGKTPIVGILERDGEVRAGVISTRRKNVLQGEIVKHVEPGSSVYTDALMSYIELNERFEHKVIDHAEKSVDGKIHTNGLENFWSLLKRGLKGTTLVPNLFIFSTTSTNRYFGTTIAPPKRIRWMMVTALMLWCAALSASASLGTN
jgi:transposase-like protein